MWPATRKSAELIKMVTYCNNMNAQCANLSCTHPHAYKNKNKIKNAKHSRVVQKSQ